VLFYRVDGTAATVSGDEHPSANQFIADLRGRAGVPRADLDACNLGKDVVTAIGHLAQLFKGFVQVAAPGGMPYRRPLQSTEEELICGGHCPSVSNVDSIMLPLAIRRDRSARSHSRNESRP
jgi:hypothetical protein